MKVAILGGGTAGFVAAAQLSKHLPQAELLHIHDTRIPTIGVGEGTTPRFPEWLRDVAGVDVETVMRECGATLKKGTQFEGWGPEGGAFVNRFQPTHRIGYHFSAARIVELIARGVTAEHVDATVMAVDSAATHATVRLEDGRALRCDYVLDARGFPHNANSGATAEGAELLRLDWIPTGRAMLRRLPMGLARDTTRAVARPHGWIFQIPLAETTSSGYLFNAGCSSDAEVEADFTEFLHGEGVTEWEERGRLDFPNFARRTMFDGRVFWIGNAASFVEPLEATSIGASIMQSRSAQRWIAEHDPAVAADPRERAACNAGLLGYVLRNSIFIAWHYASGARWDTPFWRHARGGMARCAANPDARPLLEEMRKYVEAGRDLPGAAISRYVGEEGWRRDILPLMRVYTPYGNFSELNFAQVGHGIGYYSDAAGGSEALMSLTG